MITHIVSAVGNSAVLLFCSLLCLVWKSFESEFSICSTVSLFGTRMLRPLASVFTRLSTSCLAACGFTVASLHCSAVLSVLSLSLPLTTGVAKS